MRRKLCFYLSLSFALVLTLSPLVESKGFCSAFKANGNKIGYTFRRQFVGSSAKETKHEVIIDGQYWTLVFNEGSKSLKFDSLESKECQLFTGSYSMAACLRTQNTGWKGGKAFLFHKENWRKVTIADIREDTYTQYEELSKYRFNGSIDLVGDGPNAPLIAYSEDRAEGHSLIVFVQKNETKYIFPRFTFIEEKASLRLKAGTHDLITEKILEDDILVKSNLISAMPRWIHDPRDEYNLILLFQEDVKIKWCWTGSQSDKKHCKDSLSVLIDCSKTPNETKPEDPKTEKTPEVDEESSSLLTYILIVLVVIAVVALIVVLIYYVRHKNTEGVSQTTASSVGGVLSKKSAVSKTGASKLSSRAAKPTPKKAAKAAPSGSAVKSAAK